MTRVLLFAPLGGAGGSLLGAVVWMLGVVMKTHTREEATIAGIQNGLAALVLTVIVTVPACLVVGSPVVYAFRRQLVRSPVRWSALVAFIGMWLGGVCFGWAFTSNTDPEPFEMLLLFSATSAFSYAWLYGSRTRRLQRGTAGETTPDASRAR